MAAPITRIPVGAPAPDFTLPDETGSPRSLREFRGKKVALFFYPEDDSPGCTLQVCDLRDNLPALAERGYTLVGVSVDPVDAHAAFSAKFSLPFPLLADPELKVVNLYGVWGEKNLYGHKSVGTRRVTYLIDEAGVIRKVLAAVRAATHAAQILAADSTTVWT